MKTHLRSALTLLLFGCLIALSNCKKDPDLPYKYQTENLNLPDQPYSYRQQDLPAHFFFTQTELLNRVTDHGATLGRVLFYDRALSLNNKIACASCHHQENGFADPRRFSVGFDEGLTKRNANSIINPIATSLFFWDARENDLKSMVLQPIKNHVEMGMDNFDALERKLATLPYYPPLFKNAFGDEQITRERLAEALSQFLNAMVTANSKFDRSEPHGWGSNNLSVFDEQERQGFELFFGSAGCANCHNPTAFSPFGNDWADIGLDVTYTDLGLGANQPGMDGMFKIPSLRNVALTAPYMHDGRFATLMDVVNHYSDNVQTSPNLDWRLRDGEGARRLNLTPTQKEALVAFLHALTDEQFTVDPKFSNPFE